MIVYKGVHASVVDRLFSGTRIRGIPVPKIHQTISLFGIPEEKLKLFLRKILSFEAVPKL
jgi:transcriptional regulator of nitric oxide reductase